MIHSLIQFMRVQGEVVQFNKKTLLSQEVVAEWFIMRIMILYCFRMLVLIAMAQAPKIKTMAVEVEVLYRLELFILKVLEMSLPMEEINS